MSTTFESACHPVRRCRRQEVEGRVGSACRVERPSRVIDIARSAHEKDADCIRHVKGEVAPVVERQGVLICLDIAAHKSGTSRRE